MRSAPCPFLLHFFFVKRQSQTALSFWWSLDKTGSTTAELLQIGLKATTFVLIRQMLSVAFEAVEIFWPVCGSYSPCADIWTPSRPPHRHGKPGDFGSFFFVCAFSAFSKIFGATFEKNTNFAMRLSRQAHDREICRHHDREICRRHFEAHLALWWNRALPPPFFWRYTTPPCSSLIKSQKSQAKLQHFSVSFSQRWIAGPLLLPKSSLENLTKLTSL